MKYEFDTNFAAIAKVLDRNVELREHFDYARLTEEEIKHLCNNDGWYIRHMLNMKLSLDIWEIAVRSNPWVIRFKKDLPKSLIKKAIIADSESIQFVDDPDQELQSLAIFHYDERRFDYIIKKIKNITLQTMIEAISYHFYLRKELQDMKKYVLENLDVIIEKGMLIWTKECQEWLVGENVKNVLRIPEEQLDPDLREKYQYLLSMKKAGILT